MRGAVILRNEPVSEVSNHDLGRTQPDGLGGLRLHLFRGFLGRIDNWVKLG